MSRGGLRGVAVGLGLLLTVSCASSGRRTTARNILIATAVATAGLAVGAAVVSTKKESDLRDDLRAGGLSGQDYVDRDNSGKRWNRISRASLFGTGLSLIGLGIIWEMSTGDDTFEGPSGPVPAGGRPAWLPPPQGAPAGR